MHPNMFAADLLERSAAGLAGYASSLLMERDPGIRDRFPDAFSMWKTHYTQRVLELAAALAAGEPKLFSAGTIWSRKAFLANQRDVSDIDLSLVALRDVLTEHLPELPAADCAAFIEEALGALQREAVVLDESDLDPERAHDRQALQYLQRVLEGDITEAVDAIVKIANQAGGASGVYTDILLPAQREIGRLWHQGEVTVAEEHLVTSVTQRCMSILSHSLVHRSPGNGKTAVAAAVASNAHDIGIRAVSDLYQLAGWRAIFLGADVPTRDLPATLTFFNADILLLGATLSTQVPRVAEAVRVVRDRCERRVKILIGGSAFDEAPHLSERIGSDGYAARADEAVAMGARLVGM